MIDHTGHQDHTAAPGGRAIQQDGQAAVCASPASSGRANGSQTASARDVLVLDPAPKARDQTFVLAPADRGVAGEFIELDMLRADDATNQQGQGVEVLFGMAAGARVQHLRQRAFDGTIGLEVDVHGNLLSSDVVITDAQDTMHIGFRLSHRYALTHD